MTFGRQGATSRAKLAAKQAAKLTGALLLSAALASCGGISSKVERGDVDYENYTAQQIFERGEYDLAANRPAVAAQSFAEIERLFPYSDLTKRAVIMQAFSYHLDQSYEESRSAAQRYIDFYPTDEDAAYAQYLLALSYYDQIDEVGRDQGLTFQALQALRKVIELYPDSEYARSAMLKFDLAFDHLAAKEMEVGRYYLKRDHFPASINRFRVVVEDFQTTSHTAEALYRLIEAYLSLGLNDEAQTAGAILGYNFRSTAWYQDGYLLLTQRGLKMEARGDNWLGQVYRQMIKGQWL
ncbi:outer membrane protein assembly factor BamD [Roseovarius sp. M141]|uniref:outer membrane protein assembly factor BamD n=1 Tax=Roseovarius sp. M141 TaxID=2583806 RepID=UPI0020CF3FE2|nr:outer membrane protein assembly factor BamD [Roseovarius sp. M141]MCQ0092464.1 outer membrane protein assembly factor BamD [Roseovarius sp. M141]